MAGFLSYFAMAVVMRALKGFWALPVAWGLEQLTARSVIPRAAQLKALSFILVALPIGTLTLFVSISGAHALGLRPLVSVPLARWLAGVPGGGAIAVMVAIAAGDFLFYWCHRAQHAIPLLWRFHAMHHSIRDLSAVNVYAHWSEDLVRILFVTIPAALVLVIESGRAPVLIGALLTLQIYYVHSVAGFHLGPLNRLLIDNRFHRIHHSLEPRHFDKNFGGALPVWDALFGTAYWPARDDWPATGLADRAEPSNVLGYLGWSFVRRRRAAATRPIAEQA